MEEDIVRTLKGNETETFIHDFLDLACRHKKECIRGKNDDEESKTQGQRGHDNANNLQLQHIFIRKYEYGYWARKTYDKHTFKLMRIRAS